MSYFHDGIDLITPLRLKPRIVGKHSIKIDTIKAGKPVTIVSARSWYTSGLKRASAKFDCDLRVHKLICEYSLWTSDCPEELYSQGRLYKDAWGDVIVGGLGIGMCAVVIANLPGVKSVTVVEIEPEIIKLVADQLPQRRVPINIVKADLYKYIKTAPHFDFAFLDIWSGTGESTWLAQVVPLLRAIYKRQGETDVTCWQGSDMAGQVKRSLLQYPMRKEQGEDHLRGWKQHWKVTGAFFSSMQNHKIPESSFPKMGELYATKVGTSEWEVFFGQAWDSWRKPRSTRKQEVAVA